MNRSHEGIRTLVSRHWRFAAGVLAAAAVTLEVCLRLLATPTTPPIELAFVHGDRNCARPVPGSVTTYRAHGLLGAGVTHRINNLGIRTDVPGHNAGLTVAVLGGSLVYGVGVPAASALPAALRARFSGAGDGTGIRFLNFGFPGFNLDEQMRELARLEPVFRPDAVIVVLDHESFQPALCSRRALPVRNLVDDNVAIARAAEKLLFPVDLFPGHALQMHATADGVRVAAANLARIHPGALLFVSVGDPGRISGDSGNPVTVDEVLAGEGLDCPAVGRGDNSTDEIAAGVAAAIAPWLVGLVRAD